MPLTTSVAETTDGLFAADVLASPLPVLVDFTAAWCPPCRMIAPVLAAVAAERGGELKVVSLDVGRNPRTTAAYGVLSMPTLMLFRAGEPVRTWGGARPKARLLAELADVLCPRLTTTPRSGPWRLDDAATDRPSSRRGPLPGERSRPAAGPPPAPRSPGARCRSRRGQARGGRPSPRIRTTASVGCGEEGVLVVPRTVVVGARTVTGSGPRGGARWASYRRCRGRDG